MKERRGWDGCEEMCDMIRYGNRQKRMAASEDGNFWDYRRHYNVHGVIEWVVPRALSIQNEDAASVL